MKSKLSSLQDHASLQEFLLGLGLSKSHLKRHYKPHELKRQIRAQSEIEIDLDVLNPNMISPIFNGEFPKIIQETADFLILHKPAGIHGHALQYNESDNVLSWLRSIGRGELLEVAKQSHERGLLYRLDQATSGVLVYVKTEAIWERLRKNFHKTTHRKRYLAIVDQRPSEVGRLNAWFDLTGKKVKAYDAHRAGTIEGSLELKILEEQGEAIVLMIDLHHGHRHQIRAHLASLGCPIRGDKLYGGREDSRLFLHAYSYSIEGFEAVDDNLGFGLDFLDLHSNL